MHANEEDNLIPLPGHYKTLVNELIAPMENRVTLFIISACVLINESIHHFHLCFPSCSFCLLSSGSHHFSAEHEMDWKGASLWWGYSHFFSSDVPYAWQCLTVGMRGSSHLLHCRCNTEQFLIWGMTYRCSLLWWSCFLLATRRRWGWGPRI